MKGNAVVRIIIYSVVIFLLGGILLVGIGADMLQFNFDLDKGERIEGAGSVDASTVRELEIEWAAGKIDIQSAETDTITFTESGTGDHEMVYEIKNGKLSIYFSQASVKFSFFTHTGNKDLTIIVPSKWNCEELTINVASADIQINDLQAYEVEINTASGKAQMQNCTFGDLNIDTASGKIHYEGTLQSLDCDAASANFVGVFRNVPKEISMESASGDLDIALPEDCGFRATMDVLSGSIFSDFPIDYANKYYSYGDEGCRINFDAVSGDIIIRKVN